MNLCKLNRIIPQWYIIRLLFLFLLLPTPATTYILTPPPPPLQATSLRSIKSLAPLLDRILVQRIKAEAKTASGIFLPESTVEKLSEAKVLAVGPGGFDKEGKRMEISVKPGDRVLIPQVSGSYLMMVLCFCADGDGVVWWEPC